MNLPQRMHRCRGFTLIELLVVMAIIALLLSLATPRYFHSVDRAKEAVLKANLAAIRDSLDKHYADTGRYPGRLQDLVERRYLRAIPVDPITDSDSTWVLISPRDKTQGGVSDVRSGAEGQASNGTEFSTW